MSDIHPRALALWLAGCFVVVILVSNPICHLLAIGAAAAVSAAAPDRRLFRRMLVIGLSVMLLRTTFFALAGHEGATTILTIPTLTMPGLLGGATLGGVIKAEVLLAGMGEGLRLTALLACMGAFLSLTSPLELIRMMPRFLFEAALVLNIAIVFAPQLIASARDIAETQRLRGMKRRHLLAGIFIPLLTTALDRSIELAESMDSRGYGRSEQPSSNVPRVLATAGAAVMCGASGALLMGKASLPTTLLALAGAVLLAVGMRRIGSASQRSAYRPRAWQARDALLAASSVAAVACAFWIARADSEPGPLLPGLPEAGATAATASLAMPALLSGVKR